MTTPLGLLLSRRQAKVPGGSLRDAPATVFPNIKKFHIMRGRRRQLSLPLWIAALYACAHLPGGALMNPNWNKTELSSAPAAGGNFLPIRGEGFRQNGTEFYCLFKDGAYRAQSQTADVEEDALLVCILPAWPFPASTVSIVVVRSGVGPVPFTGSNYLQTQFEYVEGWQYGHQSNPAAIAASGGTELILVGYGLDSTVFDYSCMFSRGTEIINVTARALNATRMSCASPAWGSSFTGSWSTVSFSSGLAAEAPVSISLFRGSNELRRTRVGTNKRLTSRPCPDKQCQVSFYAVWTAAELHGRRSAQLQSSADGGGIISISGSGFDVGQQYFCAFEDASGNIVAALPSYPNSTQQLECVVPAWPHPAANCSMTLNVLHANGTEDSLRWGAISSDGRTFTLTYLPELSSFSPRSGFAKGGTTLMMRGEGFDGSNRSVYRCVFSQQGVGQTSSAALVLNTSALTCVTLPWPWAAASVNISLTVDGSLTWTLRPEAGSDFTFVEGWDYRVDGLADGPASGGSELAFAGNGFGGSYRCSFGSMLSVDATVVNSTRISCVTPPWGSLFPSGAAVLRLLRWDGGMLSEVAFLNGTTEVVNATSATCSSNTCVFEFFAVWTGITNTAGSAFGGTIVAVQGYGFDVNSTLYTCRWSTVDDIQDSAPVAAPNVSVILCLSPVWTSLASVVDVSLVNVTRIVENEATTSFTFRSAWESKNISAAPAVGGLGIRIDGIGFDVAASFLCVFSAGAFSSNSSATALDTRTMVCGVPAWPRGAQTVAFSVLRNDSDTLPFSGLASQTVFQFTAGVYGIANESSTRGEASGGTSLVLEGFGFDRDAAYNCTFFRTADGGLQALSSAATVLDSESLACDTPAWGSSFGASVTAVGVHSADMARVPLVDRRFEDLNTTECAAGAAAARCSFKFTAVWDNTRTSPTVFTAAGAEPVSLSGFGFIVGTNYSCRFAFGAYNVTTIGTPVDPESILCSSPVWRFEAVPNAVLDLALEQASLSRATPSFEQLFAIVPVVTSLWPTFGGAAGGGTIVVSGNGFNSNLAYLCELQLVQFSAAFVSDSELRCTVPVQNWAFEDSEIVFYEDGEQLLTSSNLTYAFVAMATAVSQTYGNRLGGVGPANTEASRITITGAGFFDTYSFACSFKLISSKTELAPSIVDASDLQQHLQVMRDILSSTNEASCRCPGGCRAFDYGSISDGFGSARYPPSTSCYWILAPSNASSVSVTFTAFDVEPSFDLVSVWACDDMQCSNASLLNLLSGSGPGSSSHIVSPTGIVLITFRSDRLLEAQGFTAVFEAAAAISSFSPPLSRELFACTLPVWDADTPWKEYTPKVTELRVLLSDDAGQSTTVVQPSNSSDAEVLSNFTFLQINQPPAFDGSNIDVMVSFTDRSVTQSNWAGTILAGIDDNGDQIAVESDQLVTFTVSNTVADLFSIPPSVSADGTLSFTVAAEQYGVSTVVVTLRDDGGTSYGGIDFAVKTFQIEVFVASSFADPPTFRTVLPISIAENSGPHIIVDAVTDIMPSTVDTLLKVVNVSVSTEYGYFTSPPILDRGSLYFEIQRFVFGNATINVTVSAFDPDGNITMTSLGVIHIITLPVNSAPSFELSNSTVTVDESKGGITRHTLPFFATNIVTGPNITSGPNAEDWPEEHQTVTFTVVGGGPAFQAQPAIAQNGSLSFVLAADISGTTEFRVWLQDSGGIALGGDDMSIAHEFTIVVRQINDQPSFAINCDPTLAVSQSFSCAPTCTMSSTNCTVNINVDENCVNCLENPLAPCNYGLVLENFATNMLKSVLDAEEEDYQTLSFIPSASNSSFAMLETEPTIDANTGTLILCLRESANGNATFFFDLKDDGGTYGGGIDTTGPVGIQLQVFPVNQQPSMEICSDCLDACCNQVAKCCGSSLVVWDATGFYSIPDFVNGRHRGWLDADGNDPEGFQSVTFTITPLHINGSVFVREPFVHDNGTLEFEFLSNVSGFFEFEIFVEDDGFWDDVASGTVARNVKQGTSYAGQNTSITSTVTIVVSDSFTVVCYNASLDYGLANASAIEQDGVWNGSLLAARQQVAAGLGIDTGRILVTRHSDGFCMQLLAASVQEALSFVQEGDTTITQLVLRGIQNATSARRSLLNFVPDLVIDFVSAVAYKRDVDNIPVFNVVNETHTAYPDARPFEVPKICGYVHGDSLPFEYNDFVSGVVSPPNSPMDSDGNVLVFFDIVPVRHRLRETMPWIEDGTDGGLFEVGPLIVANCPDSCINATGRHPGCQYMATCREGTLLAVQNAEVQGEAEYRMTLRGSNKTSHFRMLSHRSLKFMLRESSIALNESLQNVSVSLPDFFYVLSEPGDSSFHLVNFSLDCIGCNPLAFQRFSLFVAQPIIRTSADYGGDLIFTQRGGMFGNATLSASIATDHPDVCEIDYLQQNVTVAVLPVNNAPFFRFNCSADPAQVHCPYPCDEPSNNCSAVVAVEEKCRYCTQDVQLSCANGFALNYFVDPSSLAPSRQLYLAEANQNMTFSIVPLASDTNASMALFALLPSIDTETGTLTFCLQDGAYGNVTFDVQLMDDGGSDRGGVDAIGTATLAVVVYPVNDQPSFEICTECAGGCCDRVGKCCGAHVTVWESDGHHQVPLLINDLFPGNASFLGIFDESSQTMTFTVNPPAGVTSAFARLPYLHRNGTLDFEFLNNVSGAFVLDVYVEDDGLAQDIAAGTVAHNLAHGTSYAGVNKSAVLPLTIVVSNSYLLVEFKAYSSNSSVNMSANGTMVNATSESYMAVNVTSNETRRVSNVTNGTESMAAFMPLFFGDLLNARLAVSTGLEINIGRVLVFRRKVNGFVLQIIGASVEETLAHARNASNISAWVRTNSVQYNTSLVSAIPYMKDLNHIPAFHVQNASIRSYAMEYPMDDPWVVERFITNIVSPPDSPIDEQGRRVVLFDVVPILHRSVVTAPWTADGTDGALTLMPPEMTPLCNPEGDFMCDSNLTLWKDALSHGQAVYTIRMMNTEMVLETNFSLTFVFSHLRTVQVIENDVDILFPQFVRSIVDPAVPYHPITEFDFFTDGASEDSDFVLQTLFEKRTTSDLNFSVSLLDHRAFPVFATPTVELMGNGFGELSFSLAHFGNGNTTFKLAFATSRYGGDGTFTVVVRSVNQPPRFAVQPLVTVIQHRYSDVAYENVVATNITTGPPGAQWDERNQSLTFSVLGLDGNQTRIIEDNNSYPIFLDWPRVHSNGTLTFRLRDDWFGVTFFRLVLQDSGGIDRGGLDQSFRDFAIEVLHTNHAPTFDLSVSSITVLENSGVYMQDEVAQNISTGSETGPEIEQTLSFTMVAKFCNLTLDPSMHSLFSIDPVLYRNGTISFMPAVDMFGFCNFDVFLFDDGGTERNGTNFSVASLSIVVELVNHAPSFQLVESTLVREEDQEGRVHVVPDFASNIVSGPPSELDQLLTFQAVEIGSVLPYDASSALRPGAASSVYLFNPASDLQVFPNGTLVFELAPFRNGKVSFALFLFDNGGTRFNGSNVSVLNFTIAALPVNSKPSFSLPTDVVWVDEGASGCSADPLLVDIHKGGWAEFDQHVEFAFAQTSGPYGVVASMYLQCAANESVDCSHPSTSQCADGRAFLWLELTEHRFGNLTFNVTMKDNGGIARGGVDSTLVEITLNVMPRNSQPSFRLVRQGSLGLEMGSEMFMENFAFAISLGRWEDAVLEGCSPQDFCAGGNCVTCEQQSGLFILNKTYQNASATSLFIREPNISYPAGILSFKLQPNVVGVARFDVVLVDSGALDGSVGRSQVFTLEIVSQPILTFELCSPVLEVFEGSGAVSKKVVFETREESNAFVRLPDLFYDIEVDAPELFDPNGQPALTPDGMLSFVVVEQFGTVNMTIWLRDDGGTDNGRLDRSAPKSLLLRILPVNDQPSFIIESFINVSESTSSVEIPRFATQISPGPRNEGCESAMLACQPQNLTFVVVAINGISMFKSSPRITSNGTLELDLTPGVSGIASVSVQLVDDGHSEGLSTNQSDECGSAQVQFQNAFGHNASDVQTFVVLVDAVNTEPSFEFPWRVRCDLSVLTPGCSCPLYFAEGGECVPHSPALIETRESVGLKNVSNFATFISPARGFYPKSMATYSYDPTLGDLSFKELRGDPITTFRGFEYSVDYVLSPDKQFVFAAEYETDSLGVFAIEREGQDVTAVKFVDRRTDKSNRLLVVGFEEDERSGNPNPNLWQPRRIESDLVCDWETFQVNGSYIVGAAAGCEDLESVVQRPREQLCGPGGLGPDCDDQCCQAIANATRGYWEMETKAMLGNQMVNSFSGLQVVSCSEESCAYTRPQFFCGETFATNIVPATIADKVGLLGAAVLTGPDCKNFFNADWDGPSTSLETFMINNGEQEAMQFDGILHTGLYITDDIRDIVERFPRDRMSAEVWFTIEADDVSYGGLVAVQQDGGGCRRGWSLAYDVESSPFGSLATFYVSVATADELGTDEGKMTVVTHSEMLEIGRWYHLVGVYNGSHVYLYLDGVEQTMEPACSSLDCGPVIYAESYNQVGTCIAFGSQLGTPFTIGTYENRMNGGKFPHVGSIKSARVFDIALSAAQVAALHNASAHTLSRSPTLQEEYWVQGDGDNQVLGLNGPNSPNHNFAESRNNSFVKIVGNFSRCRDYQCRFTYTDPWGKAHSVDSEFGTLGCSLQDCYFLFADLLTCKIPEWFFGFKATVMSVHSVQKNLTNTSFVASGIDLNSTAANATFPEDSQLGPACLGGHQTNRALSARGNGSLWQKVCLTRSCGFVAFGERAGGLAYWYLYDGTYALHPQLKGSLTRFRFVDPSAVYVFDLQREQLLPLSPFEFTPCAIGNCQWEKTTCQDGPNIGISCDDDHACGSGFKCSSATPKRVIGARSFSYLHSGGRDFLLVARGWDGLTAVTQSSVFEVVVIHPPMPNTTMPAMVNCSAVNCTMSSDAGVGPNTTDQSIDVQMSFLQGVNTEGAGNWEYGSFEDLREFVAVSQLLGPSALFPWDPTSDPPIDISNKVEFHPAGASKIEIFEMLNRTFLAAATFEDGTHSALYEVQSLGAFRVLSVTHVLDIETPGGALDVLHMKLNGSHYLAFAIAASDRPSVVYKCAGIASGLQCALYQSLDTTSARSLQSFEAGSIYLLIAQERNSKMQRWNGTVFLGEITADTNPRDTGAGLELPNISQTLAYFGPTTNGSTSDYFLAGRFVEEGDEGEFAIESYLWSGFDEVVFGMDGPQSVQVSPVDGRFIYVAGELSQVISIYALRNQSGTIQYLEDRVYLEGLQQIAISPDQRHLYATVYVPGSIVAFEVDNVTGRLTELQRIENSADWEVGVGLIEGLGGASGLYVSEDGRSVYVAGYIENAVVAFNRNSSGHLSYSDRLINGERSIFSFHDVINDRARLDSGQDASAFPRRLPGESASGGMSPARGSTAFKSENVLYLAVAFSDEEPGQSEDTVVVYRWNAMSMAFEMLQSTDRDSSASCVEHVPFTTDSGDHQSYLLVGNAYHGSEGGSGISVYQLVAGSFDLKYVIGDNRTLFPMGLYPSNIQHFTIGDVHHLAVSCYHDQASPHTKSYVMRAGTDRGVDAEANLVQQMRLDVLQVFDTNGATDFVYWETSGGRDSFLMLANFLGDDGGTDSQVHVYRFDRPSQMFVMSQTIPAAGVFDLEAFHIPDLGDLLAISNRQVEPAFTIGDLPNYDAVSEIYLYDSRVQSWVLFQQLGDAFHSLMEEFSFEVSTGDYEGVYSLYFCRPHCVDNRSPQGVKVSLPHLRGVTSITAFHSDGETYLALAQSVCDRYVGVDRCAATMPQPQSAILQFNRQTRQFGEMLAAPPGVWNGSRKRLQRLERALRIDAGRTASFNFLEVDGIKMLLACSLSSGAVLYEWDFSVVTGLAGVTSVTSDDNDERVLLVSRGDRAVALLRRELYVDDLGLKPSTCSDVRCLHIAEVLSETPKYVSRLQPAEIVRDHGLGSATKIRFWEAESCPPGSKCVVAVSGRQPRDELQCLSYPPVREDASVQAGVNVDAACQNVEFRVRWVSDDNPNLFQRVPSLSPDGTLVFEAQVAQQGTATFEAFLLDDKGAMSGSRLFTIAVLEVNRQPFFQSMDVVANAGAGVQNLHFAFDVSAGQEEDQELVWTFSYSSEISLGEQVSMSVVDTPLGKEGVVSVNPPAGFSGTANFSVFLSDFGPSDFARGDVNRSQTQFFTLTVRRVNLPPVLELPSEVQVIENSGIEIRPSFLTVLSLGSNEEFNQSVTLSVFDVQPDEGFFERIEIAPDGRLEFEVAANRNGIANVTLKAQDNGGTALNGVDTSYVVFSVLVLPRNSKPSIVAPAELVAISSVYDQSEITVDGFLTFLPPPSDEASQNVTFYIDSVSNQALFSMLPSLDSFGTLFFALRPQETGEALIRVLAKDDGGVDFGGQDTAIHDTVLEVVSGLRNPDFTIPALLDYVEGAGAAIAPSFVRENGQVPTSNFQSISFSVAVQVANTRLFVELPRISPEGELTFSALEEEFGQADLVVTAHFDRRLLNDNIPGVLVLPTSKLRILPRPRVFRISPNVGTGLGGTRVTIFGDHMGSQATKHNVTVTIGGEACGSVSWLSRVQLSCVSPPGLGPADVKVAIGQGLSYRTATLPHAFTHAVLYYGGTDISADAGYLAAAPSTSEIGRTIAASLWHSSLELTATVSAIESWAGKVIVASSYEPEDASAVRAGHVMQWDGESASPLANGLDGPVSTLADYQGLLIVGGVFSVAHQERGKGSLKSGGMVGWDGEAWQLVGGSRLQGGLSATLVDGSTLYVAGSFQRVGGLPCEGLASFNGTAWSCPWGRIEGGSIREMVIWRDSLVIGGSFSTVGGVRSGQLARWEQGQWIAMNGVKGVVHSLAHQEDRVYVGGEFALEDHSKPVNLAYYSSAKFHVVGQGLDRGVYALTLAHNCLYVGGTFHQYAVRFCASESKLDAEMEVVVMGDGSPLPGPIRVIAHSVGRERGEQTTHTTNFASADYNAEIIKEEL